MRTSSTVSPASPFSILHSPLSSPPPGFTLIELIAAIVLGALMMTMLVVYMGRTLSKSASSALDVAQSTELQSAMGRMWGDYYKTTNIFSLYTNVNNRKYGNYHVVTNGYVSFDSSFQEIPALGTEPYLFLKVTISNTANERLTSLFKRP